MTSSRRARRGLDIWETEYLQILEGADPVKEWTKGTWLKPLLDALEEPERSRFEARYAELVARAYPPRGGRAHPVSVPAPLHRGPGALRTA